VQSQGSLQQLWLQGDGTTPSSIIYLFSAKQSCISVNLPSE